MIGAKRIGVIRGVPPAWPPRRRGEREAGQGPAESRRATHPAGTYVPGPGATVVADGGPMQGAHPPDGATAGP
jgi:hypothetical protein